MLVQIRPGPGEANPEKEQLPLNHKGPSGADRRIQNAQVGRRLGIPLGDYGVLGPELLRVVQEQGRSDFDRKRQNEYQAVQGRGAAIQPAQRPRSLLVVPALPRRQDWRNDGSLAEKERSST